MIYVMSDIHGCYEKYKAMLEKIKFSSADTLYILGDVIDRGEDGIEILSDMINHFNIVPMLGNHELMAYSVLTRLNNEITDDSIGSVLNEKVLKSMYSWLENGGRVTMDRFSKLNQMKKNRILNFFEDFSVYEELSVGGRDFVLVHSGLGGFSPDKAFEDYTVNELVWDRPDYGKRYFEDKYLVTGQTQTFMIDKYYCGRIYKKNGHIAIDCGVVYGYKLGCLCLDTMEEFYV